MIRTTTAQWEGNLKDGQGFLTTASNILKQTNYSYKTRFEDGASGTNPEELLAAAHAGCFTMAVVAMLTQKNITPTALDTEATITMEGLSISAIHLYITGLVPGITADDFTAITKDAEKNCLISKVLNISIISDAYLI
jgi:osmotically inducible protein OsmC